MADDGLDDIFVKSDQLDTLFGPPLQRAAYSDRTAHLMACMAQAAYYAFEGKRGITEWVTDLVKDGDGKLTRERAKEMLEAFVAEIRDDKETSVETFREALKIAGFELLNTYDPPGFDTQGFLAKRITDNPGHEMLILAFRGTEPHKVRDWLTDLDAVLDSPDKGRPGEKVHRGFYKAYRSVEREIMADLKKYKGPPVYITGHSLGGALAILATRFASKDSLGACYTFGGPRVANSKLDDIMFTPIYRIVNAADVVARVPPSKESIQILTWILDLLTAFFPVLGQIAKRIRRDYGEFTHFGDMRYLSHVPDPASPDLEVVANPNTLQLVFWTYARVFRLKLNHGLRKIFRNAMAGIEDHDMATYRKKLRQYAIRRALVARQEKEMGERLNSAAPEPSSPTGDI